MNDIPANLLCSPYELERWLDETSVPLSDDEIKDMSAYFQSESFKYTESNLCDIIKVDKDNKKQTK